MRRIIKYFLLLLVTLLASCSGDNPAPVQSDLDYFPLKKGVYQIYKMDETEYPVAGGSIKRNYELMTEVVDSFPGSEGYTYVIYRSTRENNTKPWAYIDTWSARVDGTKVIVNEGSIPYVKLVLPAGEGKKWNGNEYNTQKLYNTPTQSSDEYAMENVGKAITVGALDFTSSLNVVQNNYEDAIVFVDKRNELYARGTGLLRREVSQFVYCTDSGCLGQKKILNGIISSQTIVEYGVH